MDFGIYGVDWDPKRFRPRKGKYHLRPSTGTLGRGVPLSPVLCRRRRGPSTSTVDFGNLQTQGYLSSPGPGVGLGGRTCPTPDRSGSSVSEGCRRPLADGGGVGNKKESGREVGDVVVDGLPQNEVTRTSLSTDGVPGVGPHPSVPRTRVGRQTRKGKGTESKGRYYVPNLSYQRSTKRSRLVEPRHRHSTSVPRRVRVDGRGSGRTRVWRHTGRYDEIGTRSGHRSRRDRSGPPPPSTLRRRDRNAGPSPGQEDVRRNLTTVVESELSLGEPP